jgi:hypothetical protein
MSIEQDSHVSFGKIGALVAERAAAQMQDECILAQHVAIAGSRRAHAKVVFLAVAQAKHRIEHPDRTDQRAADVKAEPDARRQIGIGGDRGAFERSHHRLRVTRRWPAIVFAKAGQRADLRVVGKRRDRSDRRVRCSASCQRIQPAAGHDRVRIEQHQVGACTRGTHTAVGVKREAEIALVGEQLHLRQAARLDLREIRPHGRVGRGVVDDDQTVIAAGVLEDALDAAVQIVRGVVDGDDDVDRHARHQRQRLCSQRLSLCHGTDSHQRNVCRAAIVWSREAISCRSAVRSVSKAFSASS